jgi:hypothetical protein
MERFTFSRVPQSAERKISLGILLEGRFREKMTQNSKMRHKTFGACLLLAIALTSTSVLYQRQNVILRNAVDRCPSAQPCAIAVLGGGFPLPFLVDRLGISVEGKLALGEDDFRIGAFGGNMAIYLGIMLIVSKLVRRKG